MKLIFSFIIIYAFSASSFGQSIEDKFTQRFYSCKEAAYNCATLITQYYYKGDLDSVKLFTNYWKEKCKYAEPVSRLQALLAINADTFKESSHFNILNNLIDYRNNDIENKKQRKVTDEHHYDQDADYPVEFDSLTVNIARELLQRNDLTPLEKLLVDFYSNNYEDKLAQLVNDTFTNTNIQSYYLRMVHYAKRRLEGRFSYYSGGWIPANNLSAFGNHMVFGYEMGAKIKRFSFDGELNYKFLKTQNVYYVKHLDSIWDSKSFNATYFGAKLGIDLVKSLKNNINIFCEAGIERNRVLYVVKANTDVIKKRLITPVYSYGIRYGFVHNNYQSINIELQNAHYFYNNSGGTDLSGNAIILTLHVGGNFANDRNKRLKELDVL
ncbi:MAG: hypothetical protein EOP00_28610 [Pedobacter sp.]|nr:MAG: hypothetical protein EOP00_28610 [Pedobacter sp.]